MSVHHRNLGLDILRSVAIGCVLACHFMDFYTANDPKWARFWYPLGFAGVEIFFVLSGFLIGGILLRDLAAVSQRIDGRFILRFYLRRWFRTLPNYLLFLIVLGLLIRPGWDQWFRNLFFVQNLLQPAPAFFDISWSLAVEEWFYLIFPPLIWGVSQLGFRGNRAVLIASVFVLVVPTILRNFQAGHNWDHWVRKMVVMRLDALMFGVILAWLQLARPAIFDRLKKFPVFVTGCVIGTLVIVFLSRSYPVGLSDFKATIGNLQVFSLFSLVCFATLPWMTTIRRLPQPFGRAFSAISQWSYSLYLGHYLILITAGGLWGALTAEGLNIPHPMKVVSMVALSFALAALVYRFFEKPWMRLRDRITLTS